MEESQGMSEQEDLLIGNWIFNSQTMTELKDIIDDPQSIFIDASSQNLTMPSLHSDKLESVSLKLEEVPGEQNEEYILPPMPEVFNNTPSVITNEDYAGPYNFEAFIDPHTAKSPWVFSALLNKVFILWLHSFPVDFKWTQDPNKRFFVRAMPLYSQPQEAHKPVMRCFNHLHENDKTNKGVPSNMWKHIIRVNSVSGDHVKYVGEKGQHLSVVVPLGQPQMGVDTVRHMYEFVCQNSCPSGMSRRPIEVVFTLEDQNGVVFGRRSVNVRICSCPKRDKEKEENEHVTKNGQAKPPPNKKRKMESGEKKPLSFSSDASDTKEYEVTLKIAGKHNVREVFKFAYNLMAGEYYRQGHDEPFKKLMKELSHKMKNPPE